MGHLHHESTPRLTQWLACGSDYLRRCVALAVLGSCAILSTVTVQAAEDTPGARDPLGLPRVPHSWIVRYEQDDEVLNRILALGRVDKTRREVRLKDEIDLQASLESATYQMPQGVKSDAVVEHYTALLGAGELFSCSGRGCGRSNDWANYIFREAMLYGLDTRQYYLAAEYEGDLVALYVIERGNRRVYAHLQVLTPSTRFIPPEGSFTADLNESGYVVLEGVTPTTEGGLSATASEVLSNLAERLTPFADHTLYVVCHLSASADVATLLERSQACAESAVKQLRQENGPELLPFAAGPMLPRAGVPASRIELVTADGLPGN